MSELVKMDKFGKIFIPVRFRRQIRHTSFQIEVRDDEIVLHPVKDLMELFGTMPDLDMADLDEVHGDDDHEDLA